jgi:hypothetical protein
MWKLLDYRGEGRKEGREMMVGQTYQRLWVITGHEFDSQDFIRTFTVPTAALKDLQS